MAVTQPQVCTNSFKFQPRNGNNQFRTRDVKPRALYSSRRMLSQGSRKDLLNERLFVIKLARKGRVRVVGVKVKARYEEDNLYGDSAADDYYSVLGVLPDATPSEIKRAYYSCMKACHPDLSGNNAETTNFCIFVNEVYEVLSDPVQRMVYDEIHGYSLRTVNPFLDDSQPSDHVFVDEFSCIGCKNCANLAPEIFAIEEDFGRARACCQSGNPDLVQQAIDSWWDRQHSPLHAAGAYLNPSLFYNEGHDIQKDQEVMRGIMICIEKMFPDLEVQDKINMQRDMYNEASGMFGFSSSQHLKDKKLHSHWWIDCGTEAPKFQHFAIRVLSQPCSASSCERNWSIFEHIHTKKRNRLEHDRLEKLVYIYHNLQMLTK